MFTSQILESDSTKLHTTRPLIKISSNSKVIPRGSEDWNKRWCVFPNLFEGVMEKILNFEVRKDDVFVISFMKAGTTWMQETAWILLNDLDYEGSKAPSRQRSTFIDANGLFELPFDAIEMANSAKSPRLIKTHLPVDLAPKQMWEIKPKIIYIARNAKDVICSSFHFQKGIGMFDGTINEFATEFLNNQIMNTPFWEHVVDYYQLRNEPNIFFVTYEEMKRDLSTVLQKLSKFLEKPEITDEQMQKVTEHLSFEKMKENKGSNFGGNAMAKKMNISKDFKFMRRGIVGSYKDELSSEMQEQINEWTKKILSKYNLKEEDIFGNFQL